MNNKFFMQQAYEQALLAYSKDEVPIGAIIVKDNKIIAKAHNQTINLQDPTAHAEILALQQASKIIGNHRLINTKLYVTLEPCIMCLGALVQARVNEVYFATTDKKAGLFSKQEFHKSNFLNHHINAYSGIMEQQSSELLKTFFTEKRIKQKNQKLKNI